MTRRSFSPRAVDGVVLPSVGRSRGTYGTFSIELDGESVLRLRAGRSACISRVGQGLAQPPPLSSRR